MIKKYTVYKHTFPDGKVYIGMTGRNATKRWCNGKGYKCNKHFDDAIKACGWDNIKHEVIASDLNKEEACEMEMNFIEIYDSTNPEKGYNRTIGGEHGTLSDASKKYQSKIAKERWNDDSYREKVSSGLKGHEVSEETRKKLSDKAKGRKHTEESKKKISEASRNISDETRKKMSDAHKGRRKSEAHRRKIGEAHKGMKRSEETRRKISERAKGRTPWNKGIKKAVQNHE